MAFTIGRQGSPDEAADAAMCGRYNLVPSAHAWADLAEVFGQVIAEELKALPDVYNIAPTQMAPIIILDEQDQPKLMLGRWGLLPPWWKPTNKPFYNHNARSETAATKPMWKHYWRHQRCLILASSWFEWFRADDGTGKPLKIPHVIERADDKEIFFAGLWSWSPAEADGTVAPTFTIVTVPSVPPISEIHERTPVVLDPKHWMTWLDRSLQDPDKVMKLVVEGAVELFDWYTVGPEVNSGRSSGPELLEPKYWPEMEAQGKANYSKEQLAWLRRAPAMDLRRELLRKIEDFELGKMPNAAERRLWVRELQDRDDADSLAELVQVIRQTLRQTKAKSEPKPPKPPKEDEGQGTLF